MAKVDAVSAFVSAVQAAEVQVLTDQGGGLYDVAFGDGVASVPVGSGGGFSQGDLDAAVKAAVDPLNAQVVLVQKALDDMTSKESLEESQVADLQKTIDAIKALLV